MEDWKLWRKTRNGGDKNEIINIIGVGDIVRRLKTGQGSSFRVLRETLEVGPSGKDIDLLN